MLLAERFQGQTTEAFYNSLRHAKPLTFDLNFVLGPKELRQYVEQLSKIQRTCFRPSNAGLPNARWWLRFRCAEEMGHTHKNGLKVAL